MSLLARIFDIGKIIIKKDSGEIFMAITGFLEILKQSCADSKIHVALEMFNTVTKLKRHAQLRHVIADPCPRCGWRLGWIPARSQICPVCGAVVNPSNVTPKERVITEFSDLII